jgi:molybdopterin-guanine dinucleotide biosynthesis protein A
MNQDKAWLEIERAPMIGRVAIALKPVVGRLGIVVNDANPQLERYREFAASCGAILIPDLRDHRGPLGGIYSALTHCARGEAALILACDLPFITTEFLSFLGGVHRRSNSQPLSRTIGANSQSVTVPLDSSNRLQPLAAIYDRSALAPVEQMLAANELKVDRLYSRVATRQVGFGEFARLSGAEKFFLNINTPEEYRSVLSERF